MDTEIFKTSSESEIERAAEIIKNGGIVVFPTETVYGLGGNALRRDAAEKIYRAKGRPSDNPLIIHLASPSDAEKYCHTNEAFELLSKAFMPGPITIILPKRDCIPETVTGGLQSVAVRVPSHPIAHRLIELSGVPIAAPSANISGKPSPTRPEHVIFDMNGRADGILLGGDCEIGLESTIIRPEADGSISLLRPGAITIEMIKALFPDKEVRDISFNKVKEGEAAPAPGMKYRHYAPNAKVIILSGKKEMIKEYMLECKSDDKSGEIGFICPEEWKEILGDNAISYGGSSGERSEEMAHNLFAVLREFDKRTKIKIVYADMPDRSGIGAAVFNRLLKAAGFDIIEI